MEPLKQWVRIMVLTFAIIYYGYAEDVFDVSTNTQRPEPCEYCTTALFMCL